MTYRNRWLEFTTGFHPPFFYIAKAGCFDERPQISFCIGFVELFVSLPIRTGINEFNAPKWGVGFFESAVWIYLGRAKVADKNSERVITLNMPWQWTWVRTSNLKKDGLWMHETLYDMRKTLTLERDACLKASLDSMNLVDEFSWRETYDYEYRLKSGEIQTRKVAISVGEREWRWLWFTRLPWPRKVSRCIEVKFNEEVGEESGSWKGGCVGCGYELRKNESPFECLKRMERDRKF